MTGAKAVRKLSWLVVWALEMVMQASCFAIFCAALQPAGERMGKVSPSLVKDILVVIALILFMMTISGYTITALLARGTLRGAGKLYLHLTCICALFNIHVSILNAMLINDSLFDDKTRLKFRLVGTLIGGLTAVAGSKALAREDDKIERERQAS